MQSKFSEMTDAEFFVECSKHLSKMCELLKNTHSGLADYFKNRPDDKSASAVLEFSMRTCIEGLADILNAIDLVDDDCEETDAVFNELRRRFVGNTLSPGCSIELECDQ